MDDWSLIWLGVAVVFAAGEMTSPGSFFMLPFAAGAAVAAVAALMGAGVVAGWVIFLTVSAAIFLALRPLVRRLDLDGEDHGIGARRLIGQDAVVTEQLPEGDVGMARIHREEWRAQAIDGAAVPKGTKVRVVDMEGTRVLVRRLDLDVTDPPIDDAPPFTS